MGASISRVPPAATLPSVIQISPQCIDTKPEEATIVLPAHSSKTARGYQSQVRRAVGGVKTDQSSFSPSDSHRASSLGYQLLNRLFFFIIGAEILKPPIIYADFPTPGLDEASQSFAKNRKKWRSQLKRTGSCTYLHRTISRNVTYFEKWKKPEAPV